MFCDILIVGAGAAGLATAIVAARASPSSRLVVVDGARKPGAKILVSGGGRCNVTNTVVTEADFNGGRPSVIRNVLRAFPVHETVAFFEELGVPLHEEPGGKLFPDSNRARDVLDALLGELGRLRVELLAATRVTAVERGASGFVVHAAGKVLLAPFVVLATGGRSLPKSGSDGAGYDMAGSLGHSIVPPIPALVPLLLDEAEALHASLAGVSHDVTLTVWVDGTVATRIDGALLWTHFGISGPAALDASRHWLRARHDGRRVELTVSFCPGSSFEDLDRRWTRLAADHPRWSVSRALASMLPASAAMALLAPVRTEGDLPLAHLSRDARRRIVHTLVSLPLPVTGSRGYNYAEVTAGGVDLAEIDPSTMESRRCAGLFLVGEILDVDGRIGGFNFQWAWSSARVAGNALARKVAAAARARAGTGRPGPEN